MLFLNLRDSLVYRRGEVGLHKIGTPNELSSMMNGNINIESYKKKSQTCEFFWNFFQTIFQKFLEFFRFNIQLQKLYRQSDCLPITSCSNRERIFVNKKKPKWCTDNFKKQNVWHSCEIWKKKSDILRRKYRLAIYNSE